MTHATTSNGVTITLPTSTTPPYGSTPELYCVNVAYAAPSCPPIRPSDSAASDKWPTEPSRQSSPLEGMEFTDQAKITLVTPTFTIDYNPPPTSRPAISRLPDPSSRSPPVNPDGHDPITIMTA